MSLIPLPAAGDTDWMDWATQVHAGTTRTFDVRFYGAVGDGTTNDTTAVQAALDAANSAGGGTVYFPFGDYLCHDLTSYTNVGIRGDGWETIIRQAGTAANNYLISVNPGSGGSSDPTTNAKNIVIRDITLRGYVDVDTTFNQQRHLLNLNAVSDVLITNVNFVGWHGDGIYLGSSNSAGVERHNQRVKIVGCNFDGLTKNNRNGISVIDGDDVLIMGCTFRRLARNDMPGCIDIEPNGSNTFAICRDIKIIGNTASDHNQNFVQIHLPASSFTINPTRFVISGNTDDCGASNTNTGFVMLDQNRTTLDDTSARNEIIIANNVAINHSRPIYSEGGIAGVNITGNTFIAGQNTSLLGYTNVIRDWRLENNTFYRCSTGDGYVMRVIQADYLSIVHNRFIDCGLTAGTQGIVVFFANGAASGNSTNVDYLDNSIVGSRMTAISSLGTHTLSASSNRRRAYRENGLAFNVAHFGTVV
jgi:Pectate lyase superfamily protein